MLAGQQFKHADSQRPPVPCWAADVALRGHVAGGARNIGQNLTPSVEREGEPEVGQHQREWIIGPPQHIRRFDIEVQDICRAVYDLESGCELAQDLADHPRGKPVGRHFEQVCEGTRFAVFLDLVPSAPPDTRLDERTGRIGEVRVGGT